jgi:hypothetical protein
VQPSKHESPRISTREGIKIVFNDEQNVKAPSSIRRSREFGSNETISISRGTVNLSKEKQSLERGSTELGIEIDCRDLQPEKAPSSMSRTWEFRSNVKLARVLHIRKHLTLTISIVHGIQIDRNFEQPEKEDGSMPFNVEFASKTTLQRALRANQLPENVLTEFGTMTDLMEGNTLREHRDSIIATGNLQPLAQIEFRGKNDTIDRETLQQSAAYE